MPEPSLAKTNPLDNDAPINAAPTRTFYPFNDNSDEQIRVLIDRTKRELDPLSED